MSNSEKIKILDQIIKLCPNIKKNKESIIKKIISSENSIKPTKELKEYVLQQIIINNKIYYRDEYNCIVDKNINIVGVWNLINNNYKYFLFDKNEFKNKSKLLEKIF